MYLLLCFFFVQTDSLGSTEVKKHMVSNLSTVAVVPITSDVPLSHFTRELCAAICNIGKTFLLHMYTNNFSTVLWAPPPPLSLSQLLLCD